jgi:8-oxo-dGTP pyrophosphatase MutT (NUDIX family)
MRTRTSLIEAIATYHSNYKDELAFKDRFLKLLDHPRAFFRDHLPGHITASSWIIDRAKKLVLLTHHAKLNRWLQPGGHADGEEDTVSVALREAREETGLTSLRLMSSDIFDMDIHSIPGRKDFPQHDHYDIRYLFEANTEEAIIISEESHELAWIRFEELPQKTASNLSILRMAGKTVGS